MKALYFNKSYNSKKTHKIMLVFLMLATIFTCLFSLSYNKTINASTRIIDDTLTPIYTFSGGGTSSSPYLISSSTALKNLATNVNNGTKYSGKYFAMTTNIDLGGQKFTPIGKYYSYPFKGIFDGKGFTISNIKINETSNPAGIFGYVEDATISNFTISNGTITQTGASQCAGGIVGWVNGSSKIEKCTNDGVKIITKSDSGNTEAGGIVGYINGSSDETTTITRCTNYADINNDSYSTGVTSAGGIVGRHNSSNNTNISLCKSFGSVYCGTYVNGQGTTNSSSILSGKNPYAGGIVGYHSKGTITKSFNYGSITAGKAYIIYSSSGKYYIKTYGVYSPLSEGSDSAYAGGIAGYSNGSITYCFNKGSITAKAKTDIIEYKFGLNGNYKINGKYYNSNGNYNSKLNDAIIQSEQILYVNSPIRQICSSIDNNAFQTKTLYQTYAYAFGICYSGNVSNCYNTGNFYGGSTNKYTYTYKLVLHQWDNGSMYSHNFTFTFTFDEENLQGPLTKGTATRSYYITSKPKTSINYSIQGDPTYSSSNNNIRESKTLYYDQYYDNKLTYNFCGERQFFTIQKSKNSNNVYLYIDQERFEVDKVNLISNMKSSAIFDNKDYMTYTDSNIYKGAYSVESKLLTKLNNNYVWGTNTIINGGTPYIKEMYWEGSASES